MKIGRRIAVKLCVGGLLSGMLATGVSSGQTKKLPRAEGGSSEAGKSVAAKLRTIVIPSVRFDEATLSEALQIFRMLAEKHDLAETDEKLRGVNIFSPHELWRGGRDVSITLDLENVSLDAALRAVGRAAGLKVMVERHAVVLSDSPVLKSLEVGAGGQPLLSALEKTKIPSLRFEEATWEEATAYWGSQVKKHAPKGSVLSEGLNAVLFEHSGFQTLKFSNLPLSEIIRYAAAMTGMTVRVEEYAIVVSKELPPEPPAKGDGAVEKEMRELMVESVRFDSAMMPEAVGYLRMKAKPSAVSISIEGDVWTDEGRLIDLGLADIPLWEAIRYSALQAKAEVKVVDGGVLVLPKGS